MGVFNVTIGVGSADGSKIDELRALVDRGAMWTWIPRDILEGLGHQPTVKRRLQTADNRIIERDAGEVPIKIGEETLTPLCIYGDPGSHILLGATTLQEFSLAPDSVNERLVPIVGLLMSLFEESS